MTFKTDELHNAFIYFKFEIKFKSNAKLGFITRKFLVSHLDSCIRSYLPSSILAR